MDDERAARDGRPDRLQALPVDPLLLSQRTYGEWSALSVVLTMLPTADGTVQQALLPLATGAPETFLTLRPRGQAPAEVLDALVQHPDVSVRVLLAGREDLPDDTAAVLAMDDDDRVLVALVSNPCVAEDLVHGIVAWRSTTAVRAAYDLRPIVSAPAGRGAGGPQQHAGQGQRAQHPAGAQHMPDEQPWPPPWFGHGPIPAYDTAQTLVELNWAPGQSLLEACEELVTGFLRRTQDVLLLREVVSADDADLREAAAENDHLPPYLVGQLARDDDLDVRMVALVHPHLPVDVLEEVLADAEELLGRDPNDEVGNVLVDCLGWSPVATQPALERLVELRSTGARSRLLTVPEVERPEWPDRRLLAHVEHPEDRPTPRRVRLELLPVQARVVLAETGVVTRAQVVASVAADPSLFDQMAREALMDWSWGSWECNAEDGWPTVIASSPGCTEAAAELVLDHRSTHVAALDLLVDNEALSARARVAALVQYAGHGRDVDGWLVPERAPVLGQAVLDTNLPVGQLVALADLLDATHGDVLAASAERRAESLVAAAMNALPALKEPA